jgi:hypothetical protein
MLRKAPLILLIAVVACGKHHDQNTGTSQCMEEVKNPFISALTQGEVDTVQTLFNQAGRGYQDIWPLYLSQLSPNAEQVIGIQFINGLPVLGDDVVFNFQNGVLTADSSVITARPLSNDTTWHKTDSDLRAAFLTHVNESKIYGGTLQDSIPYTPSTAKYEDSCLQKTLGYVDSVFVPGTQAHGGIYLVKVWAISPLNTNYPLVYVEDQGSIAWGQPEYIP